MNIVPISFNVFVCKYVYMYIICRTFNVLTHVYFRMKKRMSTLLHTHVALIILTACATLDAACVIGQIIADILIMKGKLHSLEYINVLYILQTMVTHIRNIWLHAYQNNVTLHIWLRTYERNITQYIWLHTYQNSIKKHFVTNISENITQCIWSHI